MDGNDKVGNFMSCKVLKSVVEFRSREWLSFETLHESWISFLQLLTQMRS